MKKTGKYLIIVGFILGSLSPYLVILLGIPPFLIGSMLILLSNEDNISKVLWIIIPIILWLPTVVIIYSIFD